MAERSWDNGSDNSGVGGQWVSDKEMDLFDTTYRYIIQNMYVHPLAQQRLLQDLISRGSAAAAPPMPQDQHPPHPESGTTANLPTTTSTVITDQLRDLLSALPSVQSIEDASQNVSSGERVDLNPLVYLMPKTSRKALDIVDFVCSGVMESGETVVQGTMGSQVVLKSGPKRPKLDSVTPMQSSGANMHIWVELLTKGMLQQQSVMDYIAYTVK